MTLAELRGFLNKKDIQGIKGSVEKIKNELGKHPHLDLSINVDRIEITIGSIEYYTNTYKIDGFERRAAPGNIEAPTLGDVISIYLREIEKIIKRRKMNA